MLLAAALGDAAFITEGMSPQQCFLIGVRQQLCSRRRLQVFIKMEGPKARLVSLAGPRNLRYALWQPESPQGEPRRDRSLNYLATYIT